MADTVLEKGPCPLFVFTVRPASKIALGGQGLIFQSAPFWHGTIPAEYAGAFIFPRPFIGLRRILPYHPGPKTGFKTILIFMLPNRTKQHKKHAPGAKRRFLLPAVFLLLSFLLMILPLEGFVSSVKAVLSYIFIPQVRLAHGTAKYAQNVHETVRELLDAHRENR